MDNVIKWVYGNSLRLTIPMKLIIISSGGKTIEDYAPTDVESIKVVLSGQKEYVLTPEIDGSNLIVDDNATLLVGRYDMTVLVVESDGTKRRSKRLNVIEICDTSVGVDDDGNFIDYVDGSILETQGKRLKWLYGNRIAFAMPMQIATFDGGEKTITDYVPNGDVSVIFEGVRKYVFSPSISGNELIVEDNANLPVGVYDMTILIEETDGTKRRGKWKEVVEICDTNEMIEEYGAEFPDGEVVDMPVVFHDGSMLDSTVYFCAASLDYNDLLNKPFIPSKTSELVNDAGFVTESQALEETDPTVPEWAKQETKPTYTAQEVGALPSNTTIPSRTSQLTNDSGFLSQSDLSAYHTVEDFEDFYNHPFDALRDNVDNHIGSSSIHVTQANKDVWNGKQNALVSGENIKTVNGESLLGEGNITIHGAGVTFRQW